MNKKLIALAVVGAVFAPEAMAQSANPVTLYGRAWVMFNNVKATGGAVQLTARNTVVNESSLIGIRGTEDLGGGLKAMFQLEMGFAPEENATTVASLSPAPTTTPISINNSPVTGRNSGVGLTGGFGTVILGRWDTPFKSSQIQADPFGQNTIGNQLSILGTGTFNRRETNTLQYWSPVMSGVQAKVMYGANEGKNNDAAAKAATATAFAQPANVAANPHMYSASLQYASGPIMVSYAYEQHKDQRGSTITAGVTERGDNIAATLTFGPVKIGLDSQKIKSTDRTDKKASTAAITYTMGKNEFMAQVGRLKNGAAPTATLQPDTKLQAVGWNYNFSKRTTFMARYAYQKNNAAANVALDASGLPALVVDNDPKGIGAGIRHTF